MLVEDGNLPWHTGREHRCCDACSGAPQSAERSTSVRRCGRVLGGRRSRALWRPCEAGRPGHSATGMVVEIGSVPGDLGVY